MTTTTHDELADDDAPTSALPRHSAPSTLERVARALRDWMPAHRTGEYRAADRALVGLYLIAQGYASVNIVLLALWADHGIVESLIPAVLIDGAAVVLVTIFADRALHWLMRSAAGVLALILFTASVTATGLRDLVTRDASMWLPYKPEVSLALAVAPTVLVGVLIVMRLLVAAARRHHAEQAAAAAAERAAQEAALEAERQREHEREQQAAADREAERRRQEAAEEAERQRLEREREQQAAAERERERLAAEERERQRQADLERERLAAEERQREAERAERAARAERRRAEQDTVASTAPRTERTAPAAAGESRSSKGRRYVLRQALAGEPVPSGAAIEKEVGAAKGSGTGKAVLRQLQDDGAVSAHDPTTGRTPDLDVCRRLAESEYPDEFTPRLQVAG